MKGYIIYISPCKRERYGDTPTSNSFVALKILYIKWNLVVRGSWSSFFMYLQYCTVVQICCTCAVNKNTRRTTGTRRDEGTRTTGTRRALTHGHLKAAHWGAKNTRLLLRSKHIAPNPRIARAPELVWSKCSRVVVIVRNVQTTAKALQSDAWMILVIDRIIMPLNSCVTHTILSDSFHSIFL